MASHDGIGVRDEQSPRRPPDVHHATPKEDRLTFYYLNYTQVPVPRSGRVEGNAHPGRSGYDLHGGGVATAGFHRFCFFRHYLAVVPAKSVAQHFVAECPIYSSARRLRHG